MADNVFSPNVASLASTLNTPSAINQPKTRKNDEIGQNEFLQLLITQLKHQDPLDPMKNDQFAVDMAQFSQVEQLIQINQKLGSDSQDIGYMASYLGREVVTNEDKVVVDGGDGGRIRMNLLSDATSVKIQLLNEDGSVKEEKDVGPLSKGKHSVALTGLTTTEGSYGYRVIAKDDQGVELNLSSSIAGIVSGFIPGADPKLIIGSREIKPSDVKEISLAG